MTMVREFRHIKMLKRAGCAYEQAQAINPAPGTLAIQCRACPLPGINLPTDWDSLPPSQRYVLLLVRTTYQY